MFRVGKIIGFQGLKGIVKVKPETNNPQLLLDIENVQAENQATGKSFDLQIASIKVDKKLLLVGFTGYPDRTSVEPLINFDLSVDENELAELDENEFWINDLIGLPVYTLEGCLVGNVSGVIESAGYLLEILPVNSSDAKKIFIPFVKDLVPKVDIKAKRIEIKEIPGLLEPQ